MKPLMRKSVPLGLALLCLAAGCQNASLAPSEGGKPVVRISNWGGAGDDGEYDKLVNDIYKQFGKDNNCVVKVEGIPDGYVPKMLLNHVADAMPDVMVLDASSAAMFINNGLLRDLTPFMEKDPEFNVNDYYPNVIDISRRGDKIFAIPGDFTPMVMYYNKDMFDAAGVPYPKPGWSFDDFVQTSKELTLAGERAGDPPKQYGFAFSNWMPAWIMWLWNNGGDVLSPDGTKATGYLDSPQNVKTISYIRDLVKKHKVSPSLSEAASLGVDLFASGKAAMVVNGHWALVSYKAAAKGPDGKPLINWERLGVVELPTNMPKSRTVMYEAGFGIPVKAKNPELAWEYIKLWSGYNLQRRYNESGIAVSARIDVSKERATSQIEQEFLKIVPVAQPPHGSKYEGYEFVEKQGKNAVDSILNNNVPVQDALTKAAKRIDQEFAKK